MTQQSEYLRLRHKGWPASNAWRAAKVNEAFASAEAEGLVRVSCEPESYYDDSYIDTWDDSEKEKEKLRKELWTRIEQEGCWICGTQYLDPIHGWTRVDSIGGFIGDDWKDSGYDVDSKSQALEALANIDPKLCQGWC